MNKEILLVVEAVCNEKGIAEETIFQAIESALVMATKKGKLTDIDVRVAIDRENGDYQTFRRWIVIADHEPLTNPVVQMPLNQALTHDPTIQVGQFLEVPMDSVPFGRIGAQAAKQVIVQKVREAERMYLLESYQRRVGQLVTGVVKRIDKTGVTLDLGGNAEAFIERAELIPREALRHGDRVRGYLKEVRSEPRGPQLLVSRTAPELLIELFKLEVPEAGEGLIEIRAAARDPGIRAKIAVYSQVARIEPVGACIGMRGARVQAVTNELAGERIDIVLWDEDLFKFVINALSPAEVTSILMDEESNSIIEVAVPDSQLPLALGRNAQNVKLASQLTGWNLKIITESQKLAKNSQENRKIQESFMHDLKIDEDLAELLVEEGFSSLEEIVYVPLHEILEIEGMDQELVEKLRNQARDAILTHAIADEEHIPVSESPLPDLLTLDGMDADLARVLAEKGISTRAELADLAVLDLTDMVDNLAPDRAAHLIMSARAAWFDAGQRPENSPPESDLLTIDGMDAQLARILLAHGVTDKEEFADLAVADLMDIVEDLDQQRAARLIMNARAAWFVGQEHN